MSSLFQKFLETRRKYGAFYAIVRVRDFLISTVKLLLSNIAVLDHNSSVKESDATPRSGRVIVVGNGPSLNMLPMHLLDGEDVFVSNNFHLMFPYISYRPRYLAMTDAYVLVESRIKTLEHAAAYERIYLPAIQFPKRAKTGTLEERTTNRSCLKHPDVKAESIHGNSFADAFLPTSGGFDDYAVRHHLVLLTVFTVCSKYFQPRKYRICHWRWIY